MVPAKSRPRSGRHKASHVQLPSRPRLETAIAMRHSAGASVGGIAECPRARSKKPETDAFQLCSSHDTAPSTSTYRVYSDIPRMAAGSVLQARKLATGQSNG